MKLGAGIAVAGIWIGVGIACCGNEAGVITAMFAVIATLFVCIIQ